MIHKFSNVFGTNEIKMQPRSVMKSRKKSIIFTSYFLSKQFFYNVVSNYKFKLQIKLIK